MMICLQRLISAIGIALLACAPVARAELIPVRYKQGAEHAYVALKTLQGEVVATGEVVQTVRGDRVTSRMVFHFRDGSIDDEKTIFTQSNVIRLISDHHLQHGPSFPRPMDMLIEAPSGQITWRNEDGTMSTQHMDLTPDVSNGLPPNLLLNVLSSTIETKVSYVAMGKKPRLITLSIKPVGTLPFTVGTLKRTATDFSLHIELGGVAGVVAPLIGKQPPDIHVWIEEGKPPVFLREEGQLYEDGPIWRMEQICPTFR